MRNAKATSQSLTGSLRGVSKWAPCDASTVLLQSVSKAEAPKADDDSMDIDLDELLKSLG